MRITLLVLALLLAGLPPPSAHAGTSFLTDPSGDTSFIAGAEGTYTPPVPMASNPESDSTDLLALDITETEDDLVLSVSVVSLKGEWTGSEWIVELTWNDRTYQALTAHFVTGPQVFDYGVLRVRQGEGTSDIARLPIKLDLDKGTVATVVPKVYLLDSANRMPLQGDALKDIHVRASRIADLSFDLASLGFGIIDRMPDASAGGAYTLQKGDVATGALRLVAPERVRVSNGGATTFIYRVDARNDADADDDARLTLGELPEGWEARLPDVVHVPAKSNRSFTVLATVPFAHKHGGYDAFTVTARSERDPNALATLRLGVLHTPIPQPAGHHAELYLHGDSVNAPPADTAFNYALMWMSTDGAHESDPVEIPPNDCPAQNTHVWRIQLNPALRMGLDFDTSKTGTLTGSLIGNAKGTASLTSALYLVDEGEGEPTSNGVVAFDKSHAVLLAEATEAKLTLDMMNPVPFALTVTPSEIADYVPFAPRKNLWLEVSFKGDQQDVACSGVHGIVPVLTTKEFKLSLPLDEYEDRLDGLAEAASLLDLKAETPVEKAGRPGSIMTYVFALTNVGLTADTFTLELAGNDAKLATLVPAGEVSLAPKETRRVGLGVAIPSDATEGTAYEVLLHAHDKDDPSKSVVGRTKTTADRSAAALDDEASILQAARAEEGRDAPGFGIVLLAIACCLAVLGRSRR